MDKKYVPLCKGGNYCRLRAWELDKKSPFSSVVNAPLDERTEFCYRWGLP